MGGQSRGSASTANMSKRGLFTRLSAPNQTLILVKARLPKRNSGAGNGANPASYGVGLSSRGPFRELARPLPCSALAARPTRRHSEPTGRANARPMTGSAKQSIWPRKKVEWIPSS